MSVDPVLVRRKMALILADMKDVDRLSRTPRDVFLADRTHQLVAERVLERIIGRMIDVNYHVITEREGIPPHDFHQSFTGMARLGVLSTDLARALAPSAGLRNRLAHEYNEIDHGLVYDALGTARANVPRYLEAVEAALGQEPARE